MSAATKVYLQGGSFQDAQGNLLAGGTITFELSEDCSTNGNGQLCSGFKVSFTLDPGGSVSAVIVLTSVEQGNGIYHGTVPGGANNAYVTAFGGGLYIIITGFGTPANNGTFLCVGSTATTLTLVNTNSVAETHAATATSDIPVALFPNSQLLPADSFYTMNVYTYAGQLALGPQYVTIPNTNPYNLDNLVLVDWGI